MLFTLNAYSIYEIFKHCKNAVFYYLFKIKIGNNHINYKG